MPPDSEFGLEFGRRIPPPATLTSSARTKYAQFHDWLADELSVEPEAITTVYLSGISKEFTARVGASLISEPLVLVVLGVGDFAEANPQSISPLDRLARMCAYVGRIQLIVVAESAGDGEWTVPYVVGPITSDLFARAQDLLPHAEVIDVVVPPL